MEWVSISCQALGGRFELPIYKENRFSRPAPYQARLSQLAYPLPVTYFNCPSLKEWACCCPPPCPQAWIHWTAVIGWLTFPRQGKEAIHYPFRASPHSLIPAEGLRHVSILLTENMLLESMCSCERSVQLNRLTLRESALPFQVWTEWNTTLNYIISVNGDPCISMLKHEGFTASIKLLTAS